MGSLMVNRRSGAAVLSLVGTLGVAAGFVGYTPITCGCIDPWITIGAGVSGQVPKSPDVLTADYIRESLIAKFTGKRVTQHDLPFATSTDDCASSSVPTHSIRCRWWLWEAEGRKKGFDVWVKTGAAEEFLGVEVVEIEHVDYWVSK